MESVTHPHHVPAKPHLLIQIFSKYEPPPSHSKHDDDDLICLCTNMANLRKPFNSKDKDVIVGRFMKPDGRCKKHPKHRQSPGVCSLCLSDKLVRVQLSAASTSAAAAGDGSSCSSSASSLSSYYSSSSGSSCASPSLQHHNDHPNFPLTTEGKRSSSLSIFLLSSKHGLVKSRSMAVIPTREENGVDDQKKNKKSGKKNGFWSKLLRPRSKRMEKQDPKVVVRSSSLREAVTISS